MNLGLLKRQRVFEASVSDLRRLPPPRVIAREEILRPPGYVLPGFKALSVTVQAGEFTATGFGEGPGAIAIQKATSEAIERLALQWYCLSTGAKESSNGWAAHTSGEKAVQSAIFELIERDVAVATWENGGPFILVPSSLWPEPIVAWKDAQTIRPEYFDLKILLSTNENGACISALLFNDRQGFVTGHASSTDLGGAILSATNECMRAAHLAVRFEYLTNVLALHAGNESGKAIQPAAHALAYAYGKPMPEEIQLIEATESEIRALWEQHVGLHKKLDRCALEVSLFEIGDRVVARVKSPKYRSILWGINSSPSKPNQSPHFVG